MSFKRLVLSVLSVPALFVICVNAYALPFTIFPKTGTVLPTTVVAGRNAVAYYTVQNKTASQRNNNFIKSLPVNVIQVTNGATYSDTCGASFNLAPAGQPGDSCTLQVSIAGAVNANSPPYLFACFPGGLTCAGTPFQLNVRVKAQVSLTSVNVTPLVATISQSASQPFTATGVYSDNSTADLTSSTTWSVSTPSIATITTSGVATGTNPGSTVITATSNGITGAATLNVGVTQIVTATLAPNTIPANSNFSLLFKQIGNGVNTLSTTLPNGMSLVGSVNCITSQNQPNCSLIINSGNTVGNFNLTAQLVAGSATLAPSNPIPIRVTSPFLYVSDYSNKLNKCPMNTANGTFLSVCMPLANPSSPFLHTSTIAFNTFNNQNYAYVGDASANLWQCPLDGVGSFSGACAALNNPSSPFLSTRNTTFHTFLSKTYAYVNDDSMNLWQCPVNSTTGQFSGACTQLSVSTNTSSEIYQTIFATFASTTYAYVADHSYGLWICPVNTVTGKFSAACTAFFNSPSFTATIGVTFNTFNGTTYAYISDDSVTVWQCPMNTTTGRINGFCSPLTNASQPFFHTTSVNFNTFAGITYAYIVDQTNAMWRCPVDTTTGSFGSSCVSINANNFIGDALGASF